MHASYLSIFAFLVAASEAIQYSNVGMLCLVNKERRKQGLKPLGLDPKITQAAVKHSQYQAKTGKMSHSGAGGSKPSKRVSDAGFKWKSVGENVAYGYRSMEEVMKQWMNSPGHRRNILSKDYTMFGSGIAYKGSTPYFTQDFGSDGKPARSVPKCDGSDRDGAYGGGQGGGGGGGGDYGDHGNDNGSYGGGSKGDKGGRHGRKGGKNNQGSSKQGRDNYDQDNSYGGGHDNYGQDNSYGGGNDNYGQDNSYGGGNDNYGQDNSYGGGHDNYGQDNAYGGHDSNGQGKKPCKDGKRDGRNDYPVDYPTMGGNDYPADNSYGGQRPTNDYPTDYPTDNSYGGQRPMNDYPTDYPTDNSYGGQRPTNDYPTDYPTDNSYGGQRPMNDYPSGDDTYGQDKGGKKPCKGKGKGKGGNKDSEY